MDGTGRSRARQKKSCRAAGGKRANRGGSQAGQRGKVLFDNDLALRSGSVNSIILMRSMFGNCNLRSRFFRHPTREMRVEVPDCAGLDGAAGRGGGQNDVPRT